MIFVGTLLLVLVLVLGLTFGRGIDAHRLTPRDWMPALGNLVVPLVLLGCSGVVLLQAGPPSDNVAAALLLVGLTVSAVVGNPVTGAVLALADPRSRTTTPDPASSPDPTSSPAATSAPDGTGPADPTLLRGGAWIGALERLVVTAGLLAGWGEAVLLIVAIKGLGRYPELRSSTSAERFIIGTFASLLWAGAVAQVLRLGLS
jgi:hypothetical protein